MGVVYQCLCILFCDISMRLCSIAALILTLHALWAQYLCRCSGSLTACSQDIGINGNGVWGVEIISGVIQEHISILGWSFSYSQPVVLRYTFEWISLPLVLST